MHEIQKKLVDLSQKSDLSALGLRQITRMIGEEHPQKVKHHMQRLGMLPPTPGTKSDADQARLVSIPLLGLANCGEATIFADSYDNQVLQVSKRILPRHEKELFAVQAVGYSMNRANIKGNNIEEGDFVIVDPNDKDFNNGDYVLSLINDMANIKRFSIEEDQVVLTSESDKNYPPIYIHRDDMEYYRTSGKVVTVLKKPKNSNTPS